MIDPTGKILYEAVENEAGVLVGDVAAMSEFSLYTRWGDWPVGAAALGALVCSTIAYRGDRRRVRDLDCANADEIG